MKGTTAHLRRPDEPISVRDSEHCIRNVRLRVRFRQVEHVAQSKHMDQNVPVFRRDGEIKGTPTTRGTHATKKNRQLRASHKGWMDWGG
jgi:hypothetical protein